MDIVRENVCNKYYINNTNNINKDLIDEISNDCEYMITHLEDIKYKINNNIFNEKEIKNMIDKLFEYRTGKLVNKLAKLNIH
jgi:Mg2+ and Co2+ transporter CorA